MKFCKDCKHFEMTTDLSLSKCLAPSRPYDLVWGNQLVMTARHSRALAITGCGEDAKWFEPKVFEPTSVEEADLDDLSKIPFGR